MKKVRLRWGNGCFGKMDRMYVVMVQYVGWNGGRHCRSDRIIPTSTKLSNQVSETCIIILSAVGLWFPRVTKPELVIQSVSPLSHQVAGQITEIFCEQALPSSIIRPCNLSKLIPFCSHPIPIPYIEAFATSRIAPPYHIRLTRPRLSTHSSSKDKTLKLILMAISIKLRKGYLADLFMGFH